MFNWRRWIGKLMYRGGPRKPIVKRARPVRLVVEQLEYRDCPSSPGEGFNHAPIGAAATVVTLEDTPYILQASDFGFSDPSNSPANNFHAVKIASLPPAGSLTLNGQPVLQNDFISVSDINAGLLAFASAPNANGAAYASLDFQAQDDGGIENGGVDLDEFARTMTIDVTPVNDAPIATDLGLLLNENDSLAFALASIFADSDGDSLSYSIAAPPEHGDVSIDTGILFYLAAFSYNGSDSFSVRADDGNGGSATALVSITLQPLVHFATAGFFAEADESVAITVTLTGVSTHDISVYYSTNDDSAEAGSDYVASGGILVIPAGETSAAFTVSTLPGAGGDGTEAFTITLGNPAWAGLGATSKTNVVILASAALDLADLNTLYTQVGTLLDDIDTLRTRVDPDNIEANHGINRLLELMAPVRNNNNVNNYLRIFDHVLTRLDEVMEKANLVIPRLAQATRDCEGVKFRISGMQSQLDDLAAALGGIAGQLENEAAALSQLAGIAGFRIARGQLADSARRLRAFVPAQAIELTRLLPAPDENDETIASLNNDYELLEVVHTNVNNVDFVIQAAGVAMQAQNALLDLNTLEVFWGLYVASTAGAQYSSALQWSLIAANDGAEVSPATAYRFACNAKATLDDAFGAAGDSYALAGIRYIRDLFDNIMASEIAILTEQRDWVRAFTGWETFGPTNASDDNLSDAIDWLNDVRIVGSGV